MLRFESFLRASIKRTSSLRHLSAGGSSRDNGNAEGGNANDDTTNPIKRTLNLLRRDMNTVKNFFVPSRLDNSKDTTLDLSRFQGDKGSNAESTDFQTHCDILVVGGGSIGSSIAFWLKEKARAGLNVVVVEKDPCYTRASTVLSVGGLRHQFSLPENIQMSLFGADFVQNSKQHLGEDVDLNFQPYGYLVLASDKGAEQLQRNSLLQNELGARNELLTAERLKARFPWLDTTGIALACHGLEREGWFDPWALLMGLKRRAQHYGAHYVNAEVVNFEFETQTDVIVEGAPETEMGNYQDIKKAVVQLPNGQKRSIKFAICVIAAGAFSANVARMAKIGVGNGLLSIPLPVEPRKRYVYCFGTQSTTAPGLGTPMTIDPTGVYFRRDGLSGNYICGRSPACVEHEPCIDNLDVDHDYFEAEIWPTLAQRVPAFESCRVNSSWAGYYEYNVFDENGIVGPHPYYNNLYIATGFSGHGIQQSPAVGRAISEMIMDGRFRSIDLTRLGFDRIIVDKPMLEAYIV